MEKILKFFVIIFVLININLLSYELTVSPIYKNKAGKNFVSKRSVYNEPLQYSKVGTVFNGYEVKSTGSYNIKTKVILVATVTENGKPVPNARVIWKINYRNKERASDKTGFITNAGQIAQRINDDDFVITRTYSEKKYVLAQISENWGLQPRGSGDYDNIELSAGQCFVELSSIETGYTEIAVYLPDETNSKKNTVFAAVKWEFPTNPVLNLSVNDNGGIKYSDLPSEYLYKHNYSMFEAVAKHMTGSPVTDYLTIQLPENWKFLYSEKDGKFNDNFALYKNSEKVDLTNEKLYKVFTGRIFDKNKKKIYASVKLNFEKNYVFKFIVKARPIVNPSIEEGAKIYNATAVLVNNGLVKYDPVTVIHGEDKLPENNYSSINVFFQDVNDPAVKGENIKYYLHIKNNGNGKILINKIDFDFRKVGMLRDSKLVVYEKGIFGSRRDILNIENYLYKNSEFELPTSSSEAIIYFEVKPLQHLDVVNLIGKINFMTSKKVSATKYQYINSFTNLSEITSVK